MRLILKLIGLPAVLVLSLLAVEAGLAATKLVSFDSVEQEQLYKELLEEYRCLKCQNQNLADSNADLAGDLRNEIREQVVAGNSRAEIDDYLVSRYGDFVLYKPRLKASTAILWFGPFVLLLIAGWYALRIVGSHKRLNESTVPVVNDDDQRRARSLMDE